jgi:putative transport protein
MVLQTLRVSPELGVFLAVGVGYWLGQLKLGSFSVGPVTAALICGLVVGNFWEEPTRDFRTAFFLLFLFANGYAAGPQFISGLKSGGLKPLILAIFVCTTGLVTTVFIARSLGLDAGIAAGLFSGSMTASAAIGTATDAIKSLPLSSEVAATLVSHVVIADALCYIFGAVGVIWFVSSIAPRLLRVNLREEARALERELGIDNRDVGVFSARRPFTARSFHLKPESRIVGQRVADADLLTPGATVFVARLRRDDRIIEVNPCTALQAEDIVVLYGHTGAVIAKGAEYGEEMVDNALLDFPAEMLQVVVTNRHYCGLTGIELRPLPETRLVVVRSIKRGGHPIPIGSQTVLEPGDVVELLGPHPVVNRFANLLGHVLRPNSSTPLSTVGLGIVLGGMIGAPFVLVGSLKLTLSIAVGVLLLGVAAGVLASRRPRFPSLPAPAVELMRDLGLAVFVASLGMMAGPVFLSAAKTLGGVIFLAGIAVTLIPPLMGLLVGRYVLRMRPILLLGALAGSQTYTGALAALQQKSGSSVAVLAFTVPYAVSNILLTAFGAAVVALMS